MKDQLTTRVVQNNYIEWFNVFEIKKKLFFLLFYLYESEVFTVVN